MFFRRRRKKNEKAKKKEVIVRDDVPIITLDNSWHQLMEAIKTPQVEKLENKLNDLLKEQGQLNTDYIEYTRMKKDMLDKILELTHQAFDLKSEEAIKEMEKQEKMILKINEKVEKIEIRLDELPEEIKQTNHALVSVSVEICYGQINESRAKSRELDQEIQIMRSSLMKKTEIKKSCDQVANQTYRYLHQLVGAEFINKLDEVHLEHQDWEEE